MATNRDESELTFEGMTARVRRFLTRVYRFPHDWGVPEPQTPENDDAIIHRRMEELRIYGCSPVRASSRLLGRNSIASGSGRPAPSPCSLSANTDVSDFCTTSDRAGAGAFATANTRTDHEKNGLPSLRSYSVNTDTFTVIPEAQKELSGTQENSSSFMSGSRVCARDDKTGYSPHPTSDREGATSPSSAARGNAGEQTQINTRPRLFRHDAKRLKRLIASAEHMIRCLIIWRAYRAMRDEKISPRFQPIPTPPPAGTPRRPQPSIHPHFAVRGLPLYEPRAPAFRISMPSEFDRSSLRRQGSRQSEPDSRLRGNERGVVWGRSPERVLCETQFRENKPKRRRLRNDDLSTHERLYLRLERLGQLYEEVDQRGARLASRWAGYVQGPDAKLVIPEAPQAVSGTQSDTHLKFSGSRVPRPKAGTGPARDDKDGGSPHTYEQSEGAGAFATANIRTGQTGQAALSATHRESGSSLERVPCEPEVRGNEQECHEAGGQTKKLAGDPSWRRGNTTEQTSRHTLEPDWATGESPPHRSHARQRIGARSKIRPLKSHDPPPDLLETATEDEAEDLHILHDAAIRAAEDFPSLCG